MTDKDEPLAALNATSVPKEAKQGEQLVRYVVSAGFVPFTFGLALQKGRVFEPKVIQGVFCG